MIPLQVLDVRLNNPVPGDWRSQPSDVATTTKDRHRQRPSAHGVCSWQCLAASCNAHRLACVFASGPSNRDPLAVVIQPPFFCSYLNQCRHSHEVGPAASHAAVIRAHLFNSHDRLGYGLTGAGSLLQELVVVSENSNGVKR